MKENNFKGLGEIYGLIKGRLRQEGGGTGNVACRFKGYCKHLRILESVTTMMFDMITVNPDAGSYPYMTSEMMLMKAER